MKINPQMKIASFFLILLFTTPFAYAQQANRDSLLLLLSKTKQDTTRVNLLWYLSLSYKMSNPDSLFFFAKEGIKLAQSLDYLKGEIACKWVLADNSWFVGDYATAIKFYLENLEFAKSQKDTLQEVVLYSTLLNSYRDQGDYKEALHYSSLLMEMTKKYFPFALGMSNAMRGSIYYGMNKYDSAYFYLNKAINYPHNLGIGWIFLMYGRTQAKLKNLNLALDYYRKSIEPLKAADNSKDLAGTYTSIGELYNETGNADSAIYYGKQGLNIAQQNNFNQEVLQSYLLLSRVYEKLNPTHALSYYKLAMAKKDSLFNQEKASQILSYKFNEELRQNELKTAQLQIKNRNRIYILLGLLAGFLLFAIFLVRNNKHKQKVNALLEKQKEEIESTLNELKETQAQLIQKEKMASLGELTAGIAHEIQNPLNFVNNFSEVSQELCEEIEGEAKTGNTQEILSITADLKQNLEKIVHHGKRADSIVKNMLQHSKASSGERQHTDINALADEYLRLAYHGLRAKDKDFNADFKLDADPHVGKVHVAPQDLGRVLLNLFNNAFYAVAEKKAHLNGQYQPLVKVSTKSVGDKIEIRVRDNGTGIPESVREKVFQPFFTTKPTGEGTGLGLSLSYDIITKGHGGELKVESVEGEFTEMIIELPKV
jgi:signal transduction histidine kinase